MAESYADEEIRIGKACDALGRFKKLNIARAARDFDVNEKKASKSLQQHSLQV